MELMAVIEGLKSLPLDELSDITVYTDSLMILQAVNRRWIGQWKERGWKTAKRKPVPAAPLWDVLLGLLGRCKRITFRHVKAHSGDHLNDFVDELAGREAGRKPKSDR